MILHAGQISIVSYKSVIQQDEAGFNGEFWNRFVSLKLYRAGWKMSKCFPRYRNLWTEVFNLKTFYAVFWWIWILEKFSEKCSWFCCMITLVLLRCDFHVDFSCHSDHFGKLVHLFFQNQMTVDLSVTKSNKNKVFESRKSRFGKSLLNRKQFLIQPIFIFKSSTTTM